MSDFKILYFHLFNAITDALTALERADYGTAKSLLEQAQQCCEESYMNEND